MRVKNIFSAFFSIGLLGIISCANQKSEELVASSVDSVKTSPKIDSAVLIEQEKALADIKFGIAQKEFERQKQGFLKKTSYKRWKDADIWDNKLGEYEFSQCSGFSYHDSIYMVELKGNFISYNYYDRDMPSQFHGLYNVLIEKYGTPSDFKGLPKWSSIDDGYYRTCAYWTIGQKSVEIRLSGHGTHYSLDLVSFLPAVIRRIELEDMANKEDATKKAAKTL